MHVYSFYICKLLYSRRNFNLILIFINMGLQLSVSAYYSFPWHANKNQDGVLLGLDAIQKTTHVLRASPW